MLEIYYTGASESGKIQQIASQSLGGFISSSLIPNDMLGNLFSDVSQLALEKKSRSTRVIAIRNISDTPLEGLKVYTECDEGAVAGTTIGYEVPTIDGCPDICSEKLPKGDALPQRVEMKSAEGNPNAYALPDIDSGNYLFIFVSRQITASTPSYTSDELLDQRENPPATSETTLLTFIWD
jgi:hypothetical protein